MPNQLQPNIVLVFSDNLGFGELGVYGGGVLRGAPTPRLDALAAHETHDTSLWFDSPGFDPALVEPAWLMQAACSTSSIV